MYTAVGHVRKLDVDVRTLGAVRYPSDGRRLHGRTVIASMHVREGRAVLADGGSEGVSVVGRPREVEDVCASDGAGVDAGAAIVSTVSVVQYIVEDDSSVVGRTVHAAAQSGEECSNRMLGVNH